MLGSFTVLSMGPPIALICWSDTIFTYPSRFVGEVSAAIKERGFFRGTAKVKSKDGSVVDIEYAISQIHGREPIELVAVARDITERRLAEEALRKAHDELEIRVQQRTSELVKANEKLALEIDAREAIDLQVEQQRSQPPIIRRGTGTCGQAGDPPVLPPQPNHPPAGVVPDTNIAFAHVSVGIFRV
jgi:hypothetical protein